MENIGQLKVLRKDQNKPLSKVYVKVYSQSRGGSVDFYKDGYTDLKGRFDYTSLSTNQLDSVEKFSILVMSNEFGAIIRDANPPKV
jgi:acyl-CoA-binding protein